MFCINCGKELPEGAKFCMMCGAKVPNIINGVEKDEKIIKRNAIEYAILSTIRDVTQYDEKYYHAVFDENDKQKICEMALTNSPIIYIDYSPDEPKLVSINSEIYEKNKITVKRRMFLNVVFNNIVNKEELYNRIIQIPKKCNVSLQQYEGRIEFYDELTENCKVKVQGLNRVRYTFDLYKKISKDSCEYLLKKPINEQFDGIEYIRAVCKLYNEFIKDGTYSQKEVVSSWYEEVKSYIEGVFPSNFEDIDYHRCVCRMKDRCLSLQDAITNVSNEKTQREVEKKQQMERQQSINVDTNVVYHQYNYYYDNTDSRGSRGESLLDAYCEYSRDRKAERDRRRREEEERKRREDEINEERRRRARESQRQWDAVKKANDERKRKGQPLLPYPPREWY